jgi:hypothetical protein
MNPEVYQIVRDSIVHLQQTSGSINTSGLEAEIINLASFLYLKDAWEIDFELDYLDSELLEQVESFDEDVVQEVVNAAMALYPKHYTQSHAMLATQSVLMNVQAMGLDDYAAFLKAYFSAKHKILLDNGDISTNTQVFNSPLNSLWNKEGSKEVKVTDSETDREVIFQFSFDTGDFNVLINPYNPNVKGKITFRGATLISGMSNDKTRMFDFYYKDSVIQEVVMHRLDKGDLVKYHKAK